MLQRENLDLGVSKPACPPLRTGLLNTEYMSVLQTIRVRALLKTDEMNYFEECVIKINHLTIRTLTQLLSL